MRRPVISQYNLRRVESKILNFIILEYDGIYEILDNESKELLVKKEKA